MANDARVAIWSNVPGGAQLRISVTGTTSTSLVTAKALVLPGNGEKQRLTDTDLQPGPAAVSLVKSARRFESRTQSTATRSTSPMMMRTSK